MGRGRIHTEAPDNNELKLRGLRMGPRGWPDQLRRRAGEGPRRPQLGLRPRDRSCGRTPRDVSGQIECYGQTHARHRRGALARPGSDLRMNTKPIALAALLMFVTALTGGVSQAQQAAKVYRVGSLFNRGPNQGDQDVELLRQGLARRGYVEGSNLVLEARFAEGRLERLPGFATELVAMGVDVIAAYGGPPTSAAQRATTTFPIVAALVANPVALGFAVTLARPGGNVSRGQSPQTRRSR